MYLLGFSIDNISLMALTLSVGLVVDDAIVMLENIVRHTEEDGESPFDAALKGSREIGFTIIAISISLVAVFIPVLLMGGVIGKIFNEFAVVVTVSILASTFVSLTLTPMLASRMPAARKHGDGISRGIGGVLERGFDAVLRGYGRALKLCFRFHVVVFAVFLGTVALTVYELNAIPKGFFPLEDIGQLQVSTLAREDISFEAMSALQAKVADVFAKSPYVAHVGSSVGAVGGGSAGDEFRAAVRGAEAARPSGRRCRRCLPICAASSAPSPGISTFMNPVQNLSVGARASASQYQFVVQSLNQDLMNQWAAEAQRRHERPTAPISPMSAPTCRTMPRRRSWSSIATRRRRSASPPMCCARRSMAASARSRSRRSTRRATATR